MVRKPLNRAQGASEVYIGSFLNIQAITDQLRGSGQDLLLICSGRDQNVSLEDLACAGMMNSAIAGWGAKQCN